MALPKEISAPALAKLLGINVRTLGKLVTKGVLRRLKRGTYDLADSVQAYVAYRERTIAAEGGTGEYGKARAELTWERVRTARMRREQMQGELLPAAGVTEMGQSIVRVFTTALLSSGTAMAPRLVNIKTAAEAAAIVHKTHCEMLEIIQQAKDMATKLADEKRRKCR
jgi:phage terminase Nu1 subunit (DNA packaging protein)